MTPSTWSELWADLGTDYDQEYDLAKQPYRIPRLPAAQCIVVPIVRQVVAPLIVRNNESEEVTEQVIAGDNRIRIIAPKAKGVERRRGSQILRALRLGGRAAANKAFVGEGVSFGDVFDLNSFVFGDSGKSTRNAIYPVHAAVLYSDALSVKPKRGLVDGTFRQGGVYEDGGNYDAEKHESSSNIFTTYSVRPGTLFVQTAVFLGQRVTHAALDHWLLAVGLAGSYGGATAVTGTNLRTHVAGVYWGTLERPINAPGEILGGLTEDTASTPETLVAALESKFVREYPKGVSAADTASYIAELVARLEARDSELLKQYGDAADGVRRMFNGWFQRPRRGRGGAAEETVAEQEG